MQTLRCFAFVLLAWCRPYYEYAPVTGASLSAPSHTPPLAERDVDASSELPSTAEREAPSAPMPGVLLPFFPFFPFPQVDIGRGYDPSTRPLAPAYGPGGGSR